MASVLDPSGTGFNAAGDKIYNKAGSGDLGSGQRRARVGGSTFTVFVWNHKPIGFARQISHQSQQPVAQGAVPIHPIDSPYPVQLVTPQALTMGTLVLELYELYNQNVWERLGDLNVGGIVDLANIFNRIATSSAPITIHRIITPPFRKFTEGGVGGLGVNGAKGQQYFISFHNCVVSNLDDGETIEIGTMEVTKTVTVNYTHIRRGGANRLLDLLDTPIASTS